MSDALGVTCGTVGATGDCCSSFVLVRYATTPIPTVMMVTVIKYQYFFRKCILVPCSVRKYFAFNDKIGNAVGYRIV